MSKVLIEDSTLYEIANKIRTKLNTGAVYKPSEMGDAIDSISTGVTPTGTINITQNGNSDVSQYAIAHVNVSNSYASCDEGKVVSNGSLVAQAARSSTITENGTYDTTLNNEVVVNVPSSGGSSILVPKTITQNGTYDPNDDSADGYSSVNVNVLPNWRDSLSVNWDFSSPVNTRGNSSYSIGSSRVFTLDGWEIYHADLEIVSGGIKLSTSGTGGYFMQRYSSAFTSATVGKTITYSALIDNQLGSETVTLTSGSGGKGTGFAIGGSYIRLFNYGTEIEFTIDIYDATKNQLIKAVKFEIGNTQTLATQINGVWVLNNEMDQNTEYVKARCGMIKAA